MNTDIMMQRISSTAFNKKLPKKIHAGMLSVASMRTITLTSPLGDGKQHSIIIKIKLNTVTMRDVARIIIEKIQIEYESTSTLLYMIADDSAAKIIPTANVEKWPNPCTNPMINIADR